MTLSSETDMQALLHQQRQSFNEAGYPKIELRIDRLDRLLAMVKKYDRQICDTIAEDYGVRAYELSRLAEVFVTIEQTKHAISSVAQWMQPESRVARSAESEVSAEVHYQPKGVVGIIAPWNFPVHLILSPLVCALAAGNRALLKPSEITPRTAQLISDMVSDFFDPSEVAVVLGGAEQSEQFSQLPFDHLVFTGSTEVGRKVMSAAAQNLTPVTLELGGKSPVVIDKGVDLETVAARLMTGKLFNSGQICVCPDYVFVPEELARDLIGELEKATAALYPSIADNPDYTAIVNDNHFRRLQDLIDDSAKRGVEVITFNPAGEEFNEAQSRKMMPRVLVNPSDDSAVMQSEIFGPLLAIKTYNDMKTVIDHIQSHGHPLALYYFGDNEEHKAIFRDGVLAGGMAVNDVIAQAICHELPFGGIGASGTGSYHGIDGFHEFSHSKAVYAQTPAEEIVGFMRPPYSDEMRGLMEQQISEG
ncbi:MAG: coniferyl-aldehyde dehydrogenase [Pseudoalteromonas tetraodonis]|jgi:coniferyl-aldehyde dehydrogenase